MADAQGKLDAYVGSELIHWPAWCNMSDGFVHGIHAVVSVISGVRRSKTAVCADFRALKKHNKMFENLCVFDKLVVY